MQLCSKCIKPQPDIREEGGGAKGPGAKDSSGQ